MKMKSIAAVITILLLALAGTFVFAFEFGYNNGRTEGLNVGWTQGYVKGQKETLASVQSILKAGAITFNWTEQADGNYLIQLLRFDQNTIMTETASISTSTFNVLNVSGFIGDNHKPPVISVNVAWALQLADGTGVRDVSGNSGNQIVDIGDKYASSLLGMSGQLNSTAYNSTVYIALGNQSALLSYSDTQLSSEFAYADAGFRRSTILSPTWVGGTGIGNGNYYNFTVSNKFTATVADCANATSLHWSGAYVSNSNMFAEANIGTMPLGQAFAINDNCTITWTITFQH